MLIFFRFLNCILWLIISTSLYAKNFPIDVYGTDSDTAEKIIRQVGPDLEIAGQYIYTQNTEDADQNTEVDKKIDQLKKKIIAEIYQINDFAYVNISPIIYHDLTMFITIDLIEKKDHKRLAYLTDFKLKSKRYNKNRQTDKNINSLLAKWTAYEKLGFDLFLKGQNPTIKSCPAYHCLFGFDHPDLKRYQAIFKKEVTKNKKKLISILRTDPSEEKRKIAAFLLAHIKNGQELIEILTPSLSDPNAEVRNNVMRVLGEALNVIRPNNFDIDPIIKALDFPLTTDRNKALYIVSSLSNQPKYARYIAQHASVPLMASLRMKQPNLHNSAYVILQQISGKSYGERDYDTWQSWFNQQEMRESPIRDYFGQ